MQNQVFREDKQLVDNVTLNKKNTMTLKELQTKLNRDKEFYGILETVREGKAMKIVLMDPSLSAISALYQILSLNKFLTDTPVRISGHTLFIVTMKK